MTDRFVVFDVETPNSRNDRMSSIGVCVVENGEIVQTLATLIDPETWFNRFNSELTGIYPCDVAGKPTFGELWELLEPIFSRGVLAAHSAAFDMGVLAKCLLHYGIDWRPETPYVCTCTMGRRCYPEMENHKLDTMCRNLGIGLDHHRADSDARACAELLMNYQRLGFNVDSCIRNYHFY